MAELIIHEKLAERLQAIARRENRPVEDVLASLLDLYSALPAPPPSDTDPFMAMEGMFDDDVTDLSETVRGTMTDYYRQKCSHSA